MSQQRFVKSRLMMLMLQHWLHLLLQQFDLRLQKWLM
jgi:hypothetical protein